MNRVARLFLLTTFAALPAVAQSQNCPAVVAPEECDDDAECCEGNNWSGEAGLRSDPISTGSGNHYLMSKDVHLGGTIPFNLMRRYMSRAKEYWTFAGSTKNYWLGGDQAGDPTHYKRYLPRPFGSDRTSPLFSASWWYSLMQGVKFECFNGTPTTCLNATLLDPNGANIHFASDGGIIGTISPFPRNLGPGMVPVVPQDLGFRGKLWFSGFTADGGIAFDGGTRFVLYSKQRGRAEYAAVYRATSTGTSAGQTYWFLPTRFEDLQYRGKATTVQYGLPSACSMPDSGFSPSGAPWVSDVYTADGAHLRFVWAWVQSPGSAFDPFECVLSDVQIEDKTTSTFSTIVHYDYDLNRSGRLSAVTWPSEGRSESYSYGSASLPDGGTGGNRFVVDAGGFISTTLMLANYAVYSQSHSAPGGTVSLSYPLCDPPGTNPCPQFAAPTTAMSYVVSAGGVDGGSTTLSSTMTYMQGAFGAQHGNIPAREAHTGSGSNFSSGTATFHYASLSSTSSEQFPLAERFKSDKRSSFTVYGQPPTGLADSGNFYLLPELASISIGALDDGGSGTLERTDYTYQYGGVGQAPRFQEQLKFSEEKPSVLDAGSKVVRKEWRDSVTNRLTKVTTTGYTRAALTSTATPRTVATFYFATRTCGSGGTSPDPFGRTLEVHGPCVVSGESAVDCAAPYPVTVNEYYPDLVANGNSRNRLYRVYRYPNGSADCSGSPLYVEYSAYDAFGNATRVTDENGDFTDFAFDSAGHMLWKSKNAVSTYFRYDQGKLSGVMYPEGNGELFCRRVGADNNCSGGQWTPQVQWRAKKACTGTTGFTCYGDWSERINYTYGADGQLAREEYRTCPPGASCSLGTEGEVRRVLKYAHDAHGRNTWRGFGDFSTGQYGSVSFYDRANNLAGVGPAYNNAPEFCGGANGTLDGPTSQLCTSLKYDRANRVAQVDEDPGVTGLPIRTCFDYDGQGNIVRVAAGCNTGESCSVNVPGGLSQCALPAITSDYAWDDFGNIVGTSSSNSGEYRRTFDARNNVVLEQNATMLAAGQWLEHTYDLMGRPTGVLVKPSNVIAWQASYDLSGSPPVGWPQPVKTKGRLRSRTDSWWSTYYGYDSFGRVAQEIRVPSWDAGVPQQLPYNPHTTYNYTSNGNLANITYPHGRLVQYVYSKATGQNDRVAEVRAALWNGSVWGKPARLVTGVRWEPYGGLRGYTGEALTSSNSSVVEYMLGDNASQVPGTACPASPPSTGGGYDNTARLRSLRVTTDGGTSGDILKRTYTWQADQISRTDTCYLGSSAAITEDGLNPSYQPAYDNVQRLKNVNVPNFATTGGWQTGVTYSYDHRKRTMAFLHDGISSIAYLHSPNNDRLTQENNGGLAQTYTYDADGRQSGKAVPNDSSGYAGTSWSFDYSAPTVASTFKAVTITSGLGAFTYNYYYDAMNRRIAKVYPTTATDFFFYDVGHQLLADQGVSSILTGSGLSYPVDDYIWLDGRPVAVIRGTFNSSWARQPDKTGTCSRNDEATACDVSLLVTDHIGKPILALDSSRRVSGVGEYEPFGALNRVEWWWGTGWTYGSGAGSSVLDLSQPHHGMKTAFRARFTRLDSEQQNAVLLGSCRLGIDIKDYIRTFTGPTGSICDWKLGGYHQGNTYSSWCVGDTSGSVSTYQLRWDTSGNNCEPTTCTCSNPNWPFGGFTMRNYEYRRYQNGATPFFPPLRFPGQYYDEETHLHENWNRYYDPEKGDYLQPEPFLQDPYWPRSYAGNGFVMPAYSYAANNPLYFVDNDGKSYRVFFDALSNWMELRETQNGNYDKFFHCKANCEASSRGNGVMGAQDRRQIRWFSEAREYWQEKVGSDSKEDCNADRQANEHGQKAPEGANCADWCSKYPHPWKYNPVGKK